MNQDATCTPLANMKPRIRLQFGLWNCYASSGWVGLGITPADAYDDWLYLELVQEGGANL